MNKYRFMVFLSGWLTTGVIAFAEKSEPAMVIQHGIHITTMAQLHEKEKSAYAVVLKKRERDGYHEVGFHLEKKFNRSVTQEDGASLAGFICGKKHRVSVYAEESLCKTANDEKFLFVEEKYGHDTEGALVLIKELFNCEINKKPAVLDVMKSDGRFFYTLGWATGIRYFTVITREAELRSRHREKITSLAREIDNKIAQDNAASRQ